ncbi:MAG: Hsp20/alpha crystallin family protein [Methylococcaceae bacterium]
MKAKEKDTEKSTDLTPVSSTASLISSDEFDSFFNDFLSRRLPRLFDWHFPSMFEGTFPKIDIIDHDNDIEVQAALAGVKKEDLEVSINKQSISIRATTRKEEKEEKEEGKYFHREITRAEFQRVVSLPENVDNDKATASFKDGILKIVVPKTEKSKRKNIEIK